MKKIITVAIVWLTLASCTSQNLEKQDKVQSWSTSTWTNQNYTLWKSQTATIKTEDVLWNNTWDKRIASLAEWDVVDPFGWVKKWLDIINNDARFRYFYQITCHHCQTLNTVFESSKTYSQFAFEKKEVSASQENYNELIELAHELKLDTTRLWVPFIYDTVTWEVLQWNEEIIDLINKEMSKWDWNFARKKSDKDKFPSKVSNPIEQKQVDWNKSESTETKWETSEK